MKKYILVILVIALLAIYNFSLESEKPTVDISQIDSIEDVIPYVDKKTLVLVDLDNTLITSAQTIGSTQWFDDMLKNNVKDETNENLAIQKAVDDWIEVQFHTKLVPIEDKTIKTMQKIQGLALHVIALTARSNNISDVTYDSLKDLGLDFKVNNNIPEQYLSRDKTTLHKNGIITAALHNKGKIVREFLRRNNLSKAQINKIIFVDDKQKNVDQFAKSIINTQINVVGLKYNGAEEDVNNYSSKLAKLQFNIFKQCGQLLPDEKVLAINIFTTCEDILGRHSLRPLV